jgi:hypothetical protein
VGALTRAVISDQLSAGWPKRPSASRCG